MLTPLTEGILRVLLSFFQSTVPKIDLRLQKVAVRPPQTNGLDQLTVPFV